MPRSVPARRLRERLHCGNRTGRPCAANSCSQKQRAKKPRSSARGSSSTTYAPGSRACSNRIAAPVRSVRPGSGPDRPEARRNPRRARRPASAAGPSWKPYLPWRLASRGELVELDLVPERVHRAPEAVVRHREELPLLDEALKRLDDELLAVAHVVEDLATKREEAAVDAHGRRRDGLELDGVPLRVGVDHVKRVRDANAEKGPDLAALEERIDVRRAVEVGDAVGVVGEEHLLALHVFPHPAQPFADVRPQAGVDERDPPALDVLADHVDLGAAAGEHEVVRHALVVSQKILLDGVALVPETQDEIRVPVMRVIAHDVPQDRPRADLDERLRYLVGVVAEPGSEATAEENDFHDDSRAAGRRTGRRIDGAFTLRRGTREGNRAGVGAGADAGASRGRRAHAQRPAVRGRPWRGKADADRRSAGRRALARARAGLYSRRSCDPS